MKQLVDNGLRPAPAGQDGVGEPHTERTLSARLRGLLALVLCLCLTLALLPAPAQAAGTPTDSWTDVNNCNIDWYTANSTSNSFTISTAAELAGLAKLVNDGTDDFSGDTITLSADIDLSAHLWPGIGKTEATAFQGTFNGTIHSISNMTQSDVTYGGLFGCINNAVVTKIHIKKASIGIYLKLVSVYGGSVVGKATNSTISDCIAEDTNIKVGDIDQSDSNAYRYLGGLVGRGDNSTFSNCGVIGLDIYQKFEWLVVGSSGALGRGTFKNCVVTAARIDVIQGKNATNNAVYKAGVGANVSYCYFGSIDKGESGALKMTSDDGIETECMDVTKE